MPTATATITILSEGTDAVRQYRAVNDGRESVGAALDALTAQLGQPTAGAFVVLNRLAPDAYFPASQADRLKHLVGLDRQAKAGGPPLSADERTEHHRPIDAELAASAAWAADNADRIGR